MTKRGNPPFARNVLAIHKIAAKSFCLANLARTFLAIACHVFHLLLAPVILNLFQDLFQRRFRNKFGMTERTRNDKAGLNYSTYFLLLIAYFFDLREQTDG
ncbi:hypothetical protein BRC19_01085 [Candidatus Saccharibacteria bacterium QS_5_54_17]|nr:MAG: hypothetical protein BRC19_01085 [Candidatus Saccharibacteria bacterium QS_5_54_17]